MTRHRDGRSGRRRMKAATMALLSTIEHRSGLSAAQLEAKFGLGLRGTCDLETGQEWLRYRRPHGASSKSHQALSLPKLVEIAALALELAYVTESDLLSLGLADLAMTDAVDARLRNERAALKLFQRGIVNLSNGNLPLAPGGAKGGRPRKPHNAQEALAAYQEWNDKIRILGCEVIEDRSSVVEQDQELWVQAEREERFVTDADYYGLPDWIRPFDPMRPAAGALGRLRIRFALGQLDQPWLPDDNRVCYSSARVKTEWPATDEEVDQFFDSCHKAIRLAAARLPNKSL